MALNMIKNEVVNIETDQVSPRNWRNKNVEMNDYVDPDDDINALKKEEDALNMPRDVKTEPDSLVKKFTQLWFACYFERKLTRQKVCEADLPHIVADMILYFCKDEDRVDFRRATPLLTGLHNLFVRRLAFLIRDTENFLKEMTDPAVVNIKDELGGALVKDEHVGSKKPRQAGNAADRGYHRPADNFKLNPKSFDWFLEGIDKNKLEALQAKLEQTIIRDENQVVQPEGNLAHHFDQQLRLNDEISEIRQIVGDDGFAQMLDQVDVEIQSIAGLQEIDFQSPQKLDGIQFPGFDLQFNSQLEDRQQRGGEQGKKINTANAKLMKELRQQMTGRDVYTTLDELNRHRKPAERNNQKPQPRLHLKEQDFFQLLDASTAESQENQFVQRLKRPGKAPKLPSLEALGIDMEHDDDKGKSIFNLDEENDQEMNEEAAVEEEDINNDKQASKQRPVNLKPQPEVILQVEQRLKALMEHQQSALLSKLSYENGKPNRFKATKVLMDCLLLQQEIKPMVRLEQQMNNSRPDIMINLLR